MYVYLYVIILYRMPGCRQQNDERRREKGYGNEIEVNKRTEVAKETKALFEGVCMCVCALCGVCVCVCVCVCKSCKKCGCVLTFEIRFGALRKHRYPLGWRSRGQAQ